MQVFGLLHELPVDSFSLPLNLDLMISTLQLDRLWCFFRPKVWLEELLRRQIFKSRPDSRFIALLLHIVHMLSLISNQVLLMLVRLCMLQRQVSKKFPFLLFPRLLQLEKVILIAMYSCYSRLVSDGRLVGFQGRTVISQTVVIHSEWSFRLKESRQSCMVSW